MEETAPTAGLIVHATAVLVVPVTAVVNCCLCPAVRVAVAGVIEMETGGFTVTTALAFLLPSAALVAVTVTVWAEATVAGAV